MLDRFVGGTTRGSRRSARWIEQSGVKIERQRAAAARRCARVLARASSVPRWSTRGGRLDRRRRHRLRAAVHRPSKVKRTRRLRTFEEAFPEALDLDLARAQGRATRSRPGLKMVADEMPEPVGPEFRKTFDEQNFGLPLKDALDEPDDAHPAARRPVLLDRRCSSSARPAATCPRFSRTSAHVVRERFKILRQVRVYTAHGRLTGYVLLALPAFLIDRAVVHQPRAHAAALPRAHRARCC